VRAADPRWKFKAYRLAALEHRFEFCGRGDARRICIECEHDFSAGKRFR
jgi:hypothetical protein